MKKALVLLLGLVFAASLAYGAVNRYVFVVYQNDGKIKTLLTNTTFYVGQTNALISPEGAKVNKTVQLKTDSQYGQAIYSDATNATLRYASKSKDALLKVLNGEKSADGKVVIDTGKFVPFKTGGNIIVFPKTIPLPIPLPSAAK